MTKTRDLFDSRRIKSFIILLPLSYSDDDDKVEEDWGSGTWSCHVLAK